MQHLIRTSKFCLPLLAVILLAMQLFFTNSLVDVGNKVKTIDAKINQLTDQNEQLSQRVAVGESLQTVETKAKALGLVKTAAYVTISSEQPVAFGQFP